MVFPYNANQINALEVSLSIERLDKYVKTVGGDKANALRLYVYNTAISEAFYTPLHGLEITLRNSINIRLAAKFGADWYKPDRVRAFQYPLTEMLDDAGGKLAEERKAVTQGGIVAALNFGFWVTVLAPRYDASLWRPALRHAFPNRPRGTERHEVHGALNAIRRLRNRVAHHEPILNRDLAADHALILQVASWICSETATWIAVHSRVPAMLAAKP